MSATATTAKLYRAEPSPEELRKEMSDFAKAMKDDPKAARQFLRNAGILTAKGTLAKAYKG
ncbi:MAG: hypothetical protein K2P57_13415 [Burkholderiales bacterium]|nr:hypothetical protein [Burkholderiales bacterium]